MTPALELTGVSIRRGVFTLAVDRLAIARGEVVGLVGPNGAGKSTLLDVCTGLLEPDRGTVRTLGLSPFTDVEAARRQIGWMTDDMPLFNVTLAEHMRLLAPFYPSWDESLAAHLVERFQLDPRKKLSVLSKGEATRARLALVLAYRPSLLLLDEPTTGLDVRARRALLAEVMEVVRGGDRAVVISSHQIEDLERVADRVVLIEKGRVVADGTPGDVAGPGRTLEERLAGGEL